jgi:hypothetical protein
MSKNIAEITPDVISSMKPEEALDFLVSQAEALGLYEDEDNLRLRILNDAVEEFGYETDNEGQIVIYTGYYQHADGSFNSDPE